MATCEDIKAGARLRGLDAAGSTEIVQVIGVSRGRTSVPSNSRPWRRWTDSTIVSCRSRSGISRLPRLNPAPIPRWNSPCWPRASNQTASGKPGAVHR